MSSSRRLLIAAGLAFAAAPVFAQPAPAPPPAASAPAPGPAAPGATPAPAAAAQPALPPVPAGMVRIALVTSAGTITLDLDQARAPVTTANYLKYVDRKLYDGATFYRASRPPGYTADDYGVIQGGLQNDPKKVLPPIAHESTVKTGIKHTDGVISMGRHAPGSAQADWFICVGVQDYLDADPKAPAKTPGFAAFGHVVGGMEVVRKILVMPVDKTKGEGAMKGEILVKPVRILTVRRVKA